MAAGFFSAGAAIGTVVLFLGKVPPPEAVPGAQSSKVFAVDGQLIANFHGEENRTIVPLEAISKNLQDAVIATEDRSFYAHPGVSLKGVARAAFANIRGGAIEQGGSTLTQQYVRNAIPGVGRERTLIRKLREAALAVKLERTYSKRKILEFYLNTVYFGRGAYGAEAAARTYFGKPAADLSLPEAAYLAGVIRSPERFAPGSDAANRIKNDVLDDLLATKVLSPEQADQFKTQGLGFRPVSQAREESVRAAYFVEYLRLLLKKPSDDGGFGLSDADILGGGLQIHTTLDLRMQDAAESAIASTLDRDDDPEAALVAIDTSGDLKAMVGGRVIGDLERARGFNFATMQSADGKVQGRQAGSAFKPFTLAAWLEGDYSVNSTFLAPSNIEITSRQCRNADGSAWNVTNFGGASYGELSVVDATTGSVNTVYAQMVDLVRPREVVEAALDAGIDERLSAVCSITLGTSPVSPLSMARAYATYSARGSRPELRAITRIIGPDGEVVEERGPQSEDAVGRDVADAVNHVLAQNVQRGTGTGARIGRPAAGKTGTTQNHGDAWFVGYTPHPGISAAVWMGFRPVVGDDGNAVIPEMTGVRGRNVTGGSFPATIWRKFMAEAVDGMDERDFPAPTLGGNEVHPSPTPCPADVSPSPDLRCITPTPSPSPTPEEETPTPSSPAPPPPSPRPSPTMTSPSPTQS